MGKYLKNLIVIMYLKALHAETRRSPQLHLIDEHTVYIRMYRLNYNVRRKKVKVRFYIAQYPVLRTAQSALHFTYLTDLFNQRPSQLLWEACNHLLQLMCERLLVHIVTTVYSQIPMYTAE